MNGIELIAAERDRQITAEGWTPEHDDAHACGQMAHAARCYLGHGLGFIYGYGRQPRTPQEWPWGAEWWKPSTDPVRDLVKAGALIAAEIDRIKRQTPKLKNPMSPEDQIIAIAKSQRINIEEYRDAEGNINTAALPDYLNDLNVMHEVEKSIMDETSIRYVEYLNRIACIWHASAACRAKAYLQALDLWVA